jgi:hypothetical protein
MLLRLRQPSRSDLGRLGKSPRIASISLPPLRRQYGQGASHFLAIDRWGLRAQEGRVEERAGDGGSEDPEQTPLISGHLLDCRDCSPAHHD